jgi:hypothetical protein
LDGLLFDIEKCARHTSRLATYGETVLIGRADEESGGEQDRRRLKHETSSGVILGEKTMLMDS